MASVTAAGSVAENDLALPKLKPEEFRVYNHMAEHMNMFVGTLVMRHKHYPC
jgi:hypothetical protein